MTKKSAEAPADPRQLTEEPLVTTTGGLFATLYLAGTGGGNVGGSDDLGDQQKQAMDAPLCGPVAWLWK